MRLCKTTPLLKLTLLKILGTANSKGISIRKGNLHVLLLVAVLSEIITSIFCSVRLEVTTRSQQIEKTRRRNLIKKAIMEPRTTWRQSQKFQEITSAKMKVKLIIKGKKVGLGATCKAIIHLWYSYINSSLMTWNFVFQFPGDNRLYCVIHVLGSLKQAFFFRFWSVLFS